MDTGLAARRCVSVRRLADTYFRVRPPSRAVNHYFGWLAERTGLEPATPGVTGRYSNQLNYRSFCCEFLVGADGIEPPTLAL